ncbi:rho guanine nucleotide exchange factor 40-like isoform X2 [Eleginops maclovinus]|uniref:rho guanine nucleotide exchange factor 40-like isoform X2 n=1 Tax=Eleginops maclovinus TaxID=56733 RepID=UPI0030805A6F
MDGESVDRCLQSTLSSLYPPYQLTAPTLLPQVLRVVQGRYRGDALHFLLHFLLPAKQLLEELQQHACVQYGGLLLRHPGWPLCLQEKLVVQLSPLDLNLLHPGDFYFLVSPPPSRPHSSSSPLPPRVLLVSTSPCRQHVEQQEVQVERLFSMEWLDSVNRQRQQRGAPPPPAAPPAGRRGRCVQTPLGGPGVPPVHQPQEGGA